MKENLVLSKENINENCLLSNCDVEMQKIFIIFLAFRNHRADKFS